MQSNFPDFVPAASSNGGDGELSRFYPTGRGSTGDYSDDNLSAERIFTDAMGFPSVDEFTAAAMEVNEQDQQDRRTTGSPMVSGWTNPPMIKYDFTNTPYAEKPSSQLPYLSWDEALLEIAKVEGPKFTKKSRRDRSWLKPCFKEVCKEYPLKSQPPPDLHYPSPSEAVEDCSAPLVSHPKLPHHYSLRSSTRPPEVRYFSSEEGSEFEDESEVVEPPNGESDSRLEEKEPRHYEVERIVGWKIEHGQPLYLTQWVGYEEKTWEPRECFTSPCRAMLDDARKAMNPMNGKP